MPNEQSKPVVLLITGSRNSQKLVGKHLQAYFEIVTADDAESAWDTLLEYNNINLLICELELALNRFGLLERLRGASDSWLSATPLLLLVGENDSDTERERAFRKGATDFINLPFVSSELIARVRLHANLYEQQVRDPTQEMQPVSAVNLLQQLSQQKLFDSRVRQELSFSQRHRSSLSLCKFRLDNIRAIIAGFDKAMAISVVKAVARQVQQSLRREDSLCYLGNAEFCLLYPATNGIGATAAINRIAERVSAKKLSIAGKKVPVTLSGAVFSCIAGEDTDFEKILAQLDRGLARAQAEGGNRIVSTATAVDERTISLDRALHMIESGKTGDLTAHTASLLLATMPLLEFADQTLHLSLDSFVQELRQRLQAEIEGGE